MLATRPSFLRLAFGAVALLVALTANAQNPFAGGSSGAMNAMLTKFFNKCLTEFLQTDLDPLGREIITCFRDNGTVQDYERLIPSH